MFEKSERASFKYWLAHWLAFQAAALACHAWRPKYLLHDWKKPWQMLLWRDYAKVQKCHREESDHHLEYQGRKSYDWRAMAIDWECSRLTKRNAQLDAYQTMLWYVRNLNVPKWQKRLIVQLGDEKKPETWFFSSVLKALDLWRPGPWDEMTFDDLEKLKTGIYFNERATRS